MVGKLWINGKDAYVTWGIFLEDGSRNKLIMAAPLKPFIENSSRLEHGKRLLYNDPRKDDRDVELTFCFVRPGNFTDNYYSFLTELYKGKVTLRYNDAGVNETYTLTYLSSRSLNTVQYLGKLSVRFNEPNPHDRL